MSARALATHHGFLATSAAVNNPPMTASLPSAVRIARAEVFAVVDNVAVTPSRVMSARSAFNSLAPHRSRYTAASG